MHKKFPKIHRLGKDEVEGILEGFVYVQEKIDGANASLWRDEEGNLHCGSRNNDVTNDSFNGLPQWLAENREMLHKVFDELNDNTYLYGEWLVKHTISYPATAYKKFYLFDIVRFHPGNGEEETPEYQDPELVEAFARKHGFDFPHMFLAKHNPSFDEVKEFAGKSEIGEEGEGVVIKNMKFFNRWGNPSRAKIVTGRFTESNAITFGGNAKHSDNYWEQYVSNKYITLARVEKAINKIMNQEDRRVQIEDTPRISSMVYHDMLTEEIWDIQKKVPTLQLGVLKRIATKKGIQIFHDWLNDQLSIAYNKNEDSAEDAIPAG